MLNKFYFTCSLKMSMRDLVLLLTNTPNVRYNRQVTIRRQHSRRLPVIRHIALHFVVACLILVSTRSQKHVLSNSAAIKTTCLNFGAKQFVQIFLSRFKTAPSLYYLGHIAGHFLLATLSHGTGLTQGIA
jgi:hypothetical protein